MGGCLGPGDTGTPRLACLSVDLLLYYIVVLTLREYRSCQHRENPRHLGGCWVTLPNINLKHCLRRWKKRAYPRIMSIRQRLKQLKTYPVKTIAACRRPGLYVGCVTVKYQNRSNTKRIVPISSTLVRPYCQKQLTPICIPTPVSPEYTAFRIGWLRRSKRCCLMGQGEERLRRRRHR